MPRVKKTYDDKSLAILVKNVGKMLRFYREEAGLSQNQLSKQSGVSISTINEIENFNVNDVRLSTVCTLSKHLDIAPLLLITPSNMQISDNDIKAFKAACKALNKIKSRLPS